MESSDQNSGGSLVGTPDSDSSDLTAYSSSTYCSSSDCSSKRPIMSSQRSRAPRGGARAGTHETGEEAQLWNDMQEKLLKLEKNEARSKELGKEIFDKEASIKAQEDAGIRKEAPFLTRLPLTRHRAFN
jgi:hypothetical protein